MMYLILLWICLIIGVVILLTKLSENKYFYNLGFFLVLSSLVFFILTVATKDPIGGLNVELQWALSGFSIAAAILTYSSRISNRVTKIETEFKYMKEDLSFIKKELSIIKNKL